MKIGIDNTRLKAFTANELDTIVSSKKLFYLWKKDQGFGDYLCLHHQGKGVS
jgi:hypothetical protein